MGHSDISVTAKIYTHMVDEVFEQNRKRLAEYANQKEQKAVNKQIKNHRQQLTLLPAFALII